MKRALCLILIAAMALVSTGCLGDLFSPPEYEVAFDPAGGKLVSGELSQFVKKGDDAVAPEVKRDGYEFAGWEGDFTDVRDNLEITAKWTKLYTVTFDAGEGTLIGVAEQKLKKGDMPNAPTAERERYIFAGWEPAVSAVTGDTTYNAVWTKRTLTAEEIFELVSPSVVEIHTVDTAGDGWQGSGFFINDSGVVLTNFHVMEGAVEAIAILKDDREITVKGVIDYDEDLDLCLIQLDISGNSFLEIAEDDAVTGQTVYAIGSPRGYTGTLSNGIISSADRVEDGVSYIQTTAPISPGNSGGPLVNEYGEVLGVNTWQRTDGQNLNFAVNVHQVSRLDMGGFIDLETFGHDTAPEPGFYEVYNHREQESNNSRSSADYLLSGYAYAAELSSSSDVDYFKITVTNPGQVTIQFKFYESGMDIGYVFGYFDGSDFKKVTISFSYNSSNDLYVATFSVSVARDYYLVFMKPSGTTITYPMYYAVQVNYN
ncbi:MAG: trypsin-like peptidase domain-containing protein [Clostridia bacterium]|nr:trypsin-like peptidase domain-containing protein [Clostridia bacterium]